MDPRPVLGLESPILGVLHLPALPGAPLAEADLPAIRERTVDEARLLHEEGLHGLILENYGDKPFRPGPVGPETVASMTALAVEVRRETGPDFALGINVLRNDPLAALAVAQAAGASFIRVNVHAGAVLTDQGLVEGRARDTLDLRRALGSSVEIWADVAVKHAVPLAPRPLEEEARDLAERGLADALLVTGAATGQAADPAHFDRVREAVPVPVLAASGVTPESLKATRARCDGVIVGSCLRRQGRAGEPLERDRIRRLLEVLS